MRGFAAISALCTRPTVARLGLPSRLSLVMIVPEMALQAWPYYGIQWSLMSMRFGIWCSVARHPPNLGARSESLRRFPTWTGSHCAAVCSLAFVLTLPWSPVSLLDQLRAVAVGHMHWFEASCDLLGLAVQHAASTRVCLHASTTCGEALRPATAWLVRAGFVSTDPGLVGPRA